MVYINESSFLKYVDVKLSGKIGVLNFYDNLCVQSKRFNIYLRPSSEITKQLGVLPDSMDPECAAAMGTALYSKMSQVDTIAEKYKDDPNLLKVNVIATVCVLVMIVGGYNNKEIRIDSNTKKLGIRCWIQIVIRLSIVSKGSPYHP